MKGGWEFPPDAFREGFVPKDLTRKIFDTAKKARRKDAKEPSWVQVFISPLRVTQPRSHGKARTDEARYNPFWIAALLDRQGDLHVNTDCHAWFVREHLAPSKEDFPILGKLSDFDSFLTNSVPPESDDWSALLDYTDELFEAVAGCRQEDIAGQEGFSQDFRIVLGKANQGINKNILDLYGAILRDDPDLPLLEDTLAPRSPVPTIGDFPQCGPQIPIEHTGQMGSEFPLTQSQRQALHSQIQTPDGRLLAINGPPGTGKTTLLQSIVASAWVNAAIEGIEPPVVLACSTNNQAVTNILDTFAKATEAGNTNAPFKHRWLPNIDSYGLYLPSRHRLEESSYPAAVPGYPQWQGLPEDMENENYVQQAGTEYLENARQALGAPHIDLDGAVAKLHQEIQSSAALLRQTIETAHSVHLYRTEANIQGAESADRHLQAVIAQSEAEIERHRGILSEVRGTIADAPWYERLLLDWNPTRNWAARQITRRLVDIFDRQGLPQPQVDPEVLEDSLEAHISALTAPHEANLGQAQVWQRIEDTFDACIRRLPGVDLEGSSPLDDPSRILETLDVSLRCHLFLLTGRYYEGRWLLEMRDLIDGGAKMDARSRSACEKRWRRFAKITPCMVSTFHRAPARGVFDYFDPKEGENRPLYDFIDLLIVDEAGQTPPQVAMPTFALARRAVVVGDVQQIEPVWELPRFLDLANRKKSGVSLESDPVIEARSVSRGSVMLLAQNATTYTVDRGAPGMLLAQHWRCVPEVIRYCNHLAYAGHLVPCRKEISRERILPAFGRAHLQSPAKRLGSSWINPGEAKAIAKWIAEKRDELETFYSGKQIEDIVGVVTPFAGQKGVLFQALRGFGLDQVIAGTVHTFQGAERPVIIFSPVYSFSGKGSYFFDLGPNMLNVAVSRAKDSFLVIGDMRLFDTSRPALPSGLLGQYLCASPANEIGGIVPIPFPEDATVEQLLSLEAHRETFRRALKEGHERVLIASPYLRPRVLNTDDIEDQVAAASRRGVEVIVFYNSAFHKRSLDRAKATEVAERLSKAGADVRDAANIHLKTLACDRHWIVAGSFNWLSAERSVESRQNLEQSFLYRGESAEAEIKKVWKELIDRQYEDIDETSTSAISVPTQDMSERTKKPEPQREKKSSSNDYEKLSIKNLATELGRSTAELKERLVELDLVTSQGKNFELTEAGRRAGGEVRTSRYGPFLVWPRDLDLGGHG